MTAKVGKANGVATAKPKRSGADIYSARKAFVSGVYIDSAGVLRPRTSKLFELQRKRRAALSDSTDVEDA